MIDFRTFDTKAVGLAMAGDFNLLINKLRNPDELINQTDRDFLADRLEGKSLKRGKKRKSYGEDYKAYEAVEWLVRIEKIKRDAAEVQVAALMGETDRNIRNRVKKCKGTAMASMVELTFSVAEHDLEHIGDYCPIILRNVIQTK